MWPWQLSATYQGLPSGAMEVPVGVTPSPVRAYIGVLQRRIGAILAVVIGFTGFSLVYVMRQEPRYEASSRVLLQGTLAEQILGGQANGSSFSDGSTDDEIQIMQSPPIVAAVTQELGHSPSVRVIRVGNTNVVEILAASREPELAAQDATTYAHVYTETRRQSQIDQLLEAATQLEARIAEIDRQLGELRAPLADIDAQIAAAEDEDEVAALQAQRESIAANISSQESSLLSRRAAYADQLDQLQLAASTTVTGGAQVVAEASEPSAPVSPNVVRDVLIGFAISLVMGISLAFLLEQLDDSIRSKSQLERLTGLTTVGLIPSVSQWRKGKEREVVTISAENSSAAEAYRSLRTSVQFIGIERPAQVIQITSALPSEGKTTTTANLAVALARAGKRVVLVDSDLRRPRLHDLFGLPNHRGLTTVLLGEISLAEAITPVPGERRLALLSSGEVPPNPAELHVIGTYAEVIATLRAEADYVIVDTPPVLPVADARIASALVDVTLLVVAANSSAEKDIRRALELLQQVEASVAGTVLNNIPSRGRYSLSYGYWYGYGPRPAKRLKRARFSGPKPTAAHRDAEDLEAPLRRD